MLLIESTAHELLSASRLIFFFVRGRGGCSGGSTGRDGNVDAVYVVFSQALTNATYTKRISVTGTGTARTGYHGFVVTVKPLTWLVGAAEIIARTILYDVSAPYSADHLESCEERVK